MKVRKFISIHFSTKKDGFTNAHKAAIFNIIDSEPMELVLVHSFAGREFLAKRAIKPDVLNFIEKFFKTQICFFNEASNVPDRIHMIDFIKGKGGKCFFLGEIEGGVNIEYNVAVSKGVDLEKIQLS